ncbi:MAG: glycoside hydrolase family 55 protein [Alistipes sp.]|nr:glycoside hydrolase family 55 protein [Alistipes sp.]
MSILSNRLYKTISDTGKDNKRQVKLATVASVRDNKIYLKFYGEDEVSPKPYKRLGSYTPYEGDVVAVQNINGSYIIIGEIVSGTGTNYGEGVNIVNEVAAKLSSVSGTVNIVQYGAKGDGITDDTYAIKNAIDYVKRKGGILYFPPGEYIFSERILIDLPIKITGASIEQTTLHFIGGRQEASTLPYDAEWWEESDAALLVLSDDVTFENFRLYGVYDFSNTYYNGISAHWIVKNANGLRYQGAERFRMTNVKVMGFRNNVYIYGGWERYFVNCIFWDATDSGIKYTALQRELVGMWSNSGDLIMACSFVNNHVAGFYAEAAFQTSLYNCVFEYNQRAIIADNCVNMMFVNCWNEANLDKIVVKGIAKFDGGYNITRSTVDHDGNGHVIIEMNSDITILQGTNIVFRQQNGIIIKGVHLGEELTNILENPAFGKESGGVYLVPSLESWEKYPTWAMDISTDVTCNGAYSIAYNITGRTDNPEFCLHQTIEGLSPGEYNIECDVMAPDRFSVDNGFVIAASYKNGNGVGIGWNTYTYDIIGNNAWERVAFKITLPEECTSVQVKFGPKNNGICYMANPVMSSSDAAVANNIYIRKNGSNSKELMIYDINNTLLGKLTMQ